jgi:ribosomal protein S18 acetylase RimI-like enzyme
MNVIRKATIADIPRLIDLLHQVNMVHHELRPDLFKPHTTKYSEKELAAMMAVAAQPIFVFDDGRVSGYAFCRIEEVRDDRLLQDRKTLYIDDLCVDEPARGRHIGRRLFEHVRDYARAIGCQAITLNVWEGNEAAMRFYRDIGMQVQKRCMEMVL